MLSSIQLLLVRFLQTDRGPEKLGCLRVALILGTGRETSALCPVSCARAASGLWGCAGSAPGTPNVD